MGENEKFREAIQHLLCATHCFRLSGYRREQNKTGCLISWNPAEKGNKTKTRYVSIMSERYRYDEEKKTQ